MPMMTDKFDAKQDKKTLSILSKMYEKTLLDGNFQRWGGIARGSGWNLKNGTSYIENFIQGGTFNSIINVEVESCLKYAKEINDTISINYFQNVSDRGYEYINVDGNNTASYLDAFISDNKKIKIKHLNYSSKIRFSELSEEDQEEIKYSEKINVVILRKITVEQMCNLFRNLNEQTKLNSQEWRQARWSPLSQKIRLYGDDNKDFFTHLLYNKIEDLDKRSHEELIAAMAIKIENNHSGSDTLKPVLDDFYEKTYDLDCKTVSYLDTIFSVCNKISSSLSGPLQNKLTKGQVQNLFDFIHILAIEKDFLVTKNNYDKIFDWFLEKDAEFRAISGGVVAKDEAEKSYIYWTKHWSRKKSWNNIRALFRYTLEKEEDVLVSSGIIQRKRTSKDSFTFDDK